MRNTPWMTLSIVLWLGFAAVRSAWAHSASDAYLNLSVGDHLPDGKTVLRGQWDIALRDLDFALGMDENGDGHLTWGEVRRHGAAIDRYAYSLLHVDGPAGACRIDPLMHKIDEHADGAYAVLLFDVTCVDAPQRLSVDYRLFFALDPSHRGIFMFRNGSDVATAVFSPQNAKIDLKL